LQLRRLNEQSQPGEQLDEVIEEIMELMIRSVDASSKEKLGRRKVAAAAATQQQQQRSSNNNNRMERMNSSRCLFGIQEDFNIRDGKLMSRSS
jgi:hypothetical protein